MVGAYLAYKINPVKLSDLFLSPDFHIDRTAVRLMVELLFVALYPLWMVLPYVFHNLGHAFFGWVSGAKVKLTYQWLFPRIPWGVTIWSHLLDYRSKGQRIMFLLGGPLTN